MLSRGRVAMKYTIIVRNITLTHGMTFMKEYLHIELSNYPQQWRKPDFDNLLRGRRTQILPITKS